jgi:FtsH-binding integral membrane protein
MSEFNYNPRGSVYEEQSGGLHAYMMKVFANMAAATGITALVAFGLYYSGLSIRILVQFPMAFLIMMIAEFGVVIAMSAGLTRYSTGTIRALMFVYAALTGVTFSLLPFSYTVGTVFEAFLFAAALFVGCLIIGAFTRVDLSKFSGIFMGALFAMVIMSLLSLFIPFLRNGLLMGYIGLALFLGLTAFDLQRIRSFYYQTGGSTISGNLAVYGAFQLYLDFINVFLYVLRILGSSRSRD